MLTFRRLIAVTLSLVLASAATASPAKPNLAEELTDLVNRVRAVNGEFIPGEVENGDDYNCHGYSCRTLGITAASSWMSHSELSRILRTRFTLVKRIRVNWVKSLARDPSLLPGDLLTFRAIDAWENRTYRIHSGVMIQRGSRLWVRSKFGKLITADVPASQVFALYKHAHQIEVWRLTDGLCESLVRKRVSD